MQVLRKFSLISALLCLLLLLLSGCLAKTVSFQYAPFQDETAFVLQAEPNSKLRYTITVWDPAETSGVTMSLLTVNGEFLQEILLSDGKNKGSCSCRKARANLPFSYSGSTETQRLLAEFQSAEGNRFDSDSAPVFAVRHTSGDAQVRPASRRFHILKNFSQRKASYFAHRSGGFPHRIWASLATWKRLYAERSSAHFFAAQTALQIQAPTLPDHRNKPCGFPQEEWRIGFQETSFHFKRCRNNQQCALVVLLYWAYTKN